MRAAPGRVGADYYGNPPSPTGRVEGDLSVDGDMKSGATMMSSRLSHEEDLTELTALKEALVPP